MKNPFEIIEEYIHASDPQVRSNAVTALGALGQNRQALESLVGTALNDEDPKVRRRAEQELIALNAASLAILASIFSGYLTGPDREKRLAAYALLGRLRSGGSEIRVPPPKLFDRLILAFLLFRSYRVGQSIRGPLFFARAWGPAVLGSIIGAAFIGACFCFSAYSEDVLRVQTEVVSRLTMATFFAMFVALASTFRTVPITLYYFEHIAALVSSIDMLLCGLAAGLVTYIAFRANDPQYWREQAFVLLIFVPFSIAAVRAGGILPIGRSRSPARQQFAQTLVGASAGMLAMSGLCILLIETPMAKTFELKHEEVSWWWFFVIPSILATAATSSWIDSQVIVRHPRSPLIWSILIVGCWVGAVTFALARRREGVTPSSVHEQPIVFDTSSNLQKQSNAVLILPYRKPFQIQRLSEFAVDCDREPEFEGEELLLSITDVTHHRIKETSLFEWQDHTSLKADVEPGLYSLDIDHKSGKVNNSFFSSDIYFLLLVKSLGIRGLDLPRPNLRIEITVAPQGG